MWLFVHTYNFNFDFTLFSTWIFSYNINIKEEKKQLWELQVTVVYTGSCMETNKTVRLSS